MKRISVLFVAAMATAGLVGASATAGAAPGPAGQALFTTVTLKKTSAGKILVNTSGSILYEFTKDAKKTDKCAGISGCTSIWVPQSVQGTPTGGAGVHKSLLSTILLSSGVRQVTYAGHPLYIYAAAPTATDYIGASQFGGRWYAIGAKGQAVKQ